MKEHRQECDAMKIARALALLGITADNLTTRIEAEIERGNREDVLRTLAFVDRLVEAAK